jgi:hypothetical protein
VTGASDAGKQGSGRRNPRSDTSWGIKKNRSEEGTGVERKPDGGRCARRGGSDRVRGVGSVPNTYSYLGYI